jgi:hypothetical protein
MFFLLSATMATRKKQPPRTGRDKTPLITTLHHPSTNADDSVATSFHASTVGQEWLLRTMLATLLLPHATMAGQEKQRSNVL